MERIDPPFGARPPASGTVFQDKAGFTYEMIECAPHKNRDGSSSFLLTMKGTCADCGKPFIFKQGPSRGSLPRRCPADAKGKGREKTYPWGSAPAVMQDGRSEKEIVSGFLNAMDNDRIAGVAIVGFDGTVIPSEQVSAALDVLFAYVDLRYAPKELEPEETEGPVMPEQRTGFHSLSLQGDSLVGQHGEGRFGVSFVWAGDVATIKLEPDDEATVRRMIAPAKVEALNKLRDEMILND